MRKPVDLDAQIKALQEKAKSLKDRQRTQLGSLVLATGADTLALETLAGGPRHDDCYSASVDR